MDRRYRCLPGVSLIYLAGEWSVSRCGGERTGVDEGVLEILCGVLGRCSDWTSESELLGALQGAANCSDAAIQQILERGVSCGLLETSNAEGNEKAISNGTAGRSAEWQEAITFHR